MNNLSSAQLIFYTLASAALVLALMIYGEFILVPLAYSLLLSMLLMPMIDWVKKLAKYHTLSFILTILGLGVALILPAYFIISQVSSLFDEFSQKELQPEQITNGLVEMLESKNLYFPNLFEKFTSDLGSVIEWLSTMLGTMVVDSGTFIIYVALAIIFSYFLTSYYNEFKRIVFAELERKQKLKWQEIISTAPDIVRSYLAGMLIVMATLAFLNGIVFFAIGLKYALIWALIIGLLAIIPYVGSVIGLFLPLSYSLLNSPDLTQPTIILISFLVIQQLEGSILTPKIVGDKIDVNPMIIIVLMLLFGKIWGVSGVLICLPLAGIVRVIMAQWQKSEFIAKIMESKG